MAKLKLGPLADNKPVKVTVELPAQLHRDLIDYGALLADGGAPIEPARLIVPMLEAVHRHGSRLRQGTTAGDLIRHDGGAASEQARMRHATPRRSPSMLRLIPGP